MKCCASCIGDRYLQNVVIPEKSVENGICDYCHIGERSLVEPVELREYFELLVGIYHVDDNGQFLVELFAKDWLLFQQDFARSNKLLAEILDDHEIVNKKFLPSKISDTNNLDRWAELRTELMHENRFFPNITIGLDRLAELFNFLLVDEKDLNIIWYRARIQNPKELYPLGQMSVPPKHKVSNGRANPAGIPYLYLASNPHTSVSEIRPHTGESTAVAEFTIEDDLKIVDLRNPRNTVSPFALGDEDEIAYLRSDIEFLEKLGEELTKPVLPKSVHIDYIPSQYLCEFAKKKNFDGVMYRSAVDDGVNIALFNSDHATAQSVSTYKVVKVTVKIE